MKTGIRNERKEMLVSYSCDLEVLVCTPASEAMMLRIWFAPDAGRCLDDYDRDETPSAIVAITPRLKVDCD